MGRSKLSDKDKMQIRKLSKEGYSRAALAAMYEVSTQTIHRVMNPDYYARNLARSVHYQRENADRIQKQRASTRREYRLSFSLKNDASIVRRLDREENINDYIRMLVLEDIKKKDPK